MKKVFVKITNGRLWYRKLEGMTFEVYDQQFGDYIIAHDWDNYDGGYRTIRFNDCVVIEGGCSMDGQADRIAALEAENEKLRNPWTRIVPGDAGTLPEPGFYLASVIEDNTRFVRLMQLRRDKTWYDVLSNGVLTYEPYAWMPWPDPAPYPGE